MPMTSRSGLPSILAQALFSSSAFHYLIPCLREKVVKQPALPYTIYWYRLSSPGTPTKEKVHPNMENRNVMT